MYDIHIYTPIFVFFRAAQRVCIYVYDKRELDVFSTFSLLLLLCFFYLSLIFFSVTFFSLFSYFVYIYMKYIYIYFTITINATTDVVPRNNLVCISKDPKENYRAMQNRRIDLHFLLFFFFFFSFFFSSFQLPRFLHTYTYINIRKFIYRLYINNRTNHMYI